MGAATSSNRRGAAGAGPRPLARHPALRLAIAAFAAGLFLLAQVPAHEYGHCALWWTRGSEAPCTVVFARPGHELPLLPGGAGAAHAGRAYVDGAPWWEHPVLYAGHVAGAVVVGLWIGVFLAGARWRVPQALPTAAAAWLRARASPLPDNPPGSPPVRFERVARSADAGPSRGMVLPGFRGKTLGLGRPR